MPSNPSGATLRIAFASSDRQRIDQHFGAAQAFVFHSVAVDRSALLAVVEFVATAPADNEGRLASKIALLDGCAAVYCAAVGASAIRQLLAQGIQPVKVPEGSRVAEAVAELQRAWIAGPTGWLARALRKPDGEARFAKMAAEGWQG
jgi:nitrogen fixation protein NifX